MSDAALAWLRAQLDDDEQVALACGDRWISTARPASWAAGFGSGMTVSAFIDEWSPARVLALIAALRQALDEFHHEAREYEVIILLARALYADRPGFPQEWR